MPIPIIRADNSMIAASVSSRLGFSNTIVADVSVILEVQIWVMRIDSVSVDTALLVEYVVDVWVLPICARESVDVVTVEVVVLPVTTVCVILVCVVEETVIVV